MRNMTAKEASKAGITDLEERKRHVQLVATKGNHLPPSAFVPVWLRRDNSGTLFEAEIVDMEALETLPSNETIFFTSYHIVIIINKNDKMS